MAMHFRNNRMLLFIGIADAYAAATEYIKLPEHESVLRAALIFTNYCAHPTHHESPGNYTDDTEMSCANARVLIAHSAPYSAEMFADAWVREFLRGGKRKGYSRRFQIFLELVNNGGEFLARIDPRSSKNGAAMRSVPFGALPIIDDVLSVATTQARITHDTPEGIFSARAVALMSHFALYETGSLVELPEYCLRNLPAEDRARYDFVFTKPWPERRVRDYAEASIAITTVHAALDTIIRQHSLLNILERIIRLGGDTDSVAAIAWGVASARFQDERLPGFMRPYLESGSLTTGAEYLCSLGEQLMDKFDC